jgi:hypothetical protein
LTAKIPLCSLFIRVLLHHVPENVDDTPGMNWLREFNKRSLTEEIRRERAALVKIS